MSQYYYDVEGLKHLGLLIETKKELFDSFLDFDRKVFEPGAIPLKYKELIAVGAAHITRCPYCIEDHTKRAKNAGATEAEIAEAIMVAVALNAGASIAHASIAMKCLSDSAPEQTNPNG